jgi:tagatose 1,6-diphosphate aldolase GatY/KbaY
MLISFIDALAEAERRGAAVGAFTAYNVETAHAVLSAAHERDVPVMLLVSDQTFRSPYGPPLLQALLAVGAAADARCCVQLDHATDLGVMRAAIEAGIGAVMADGSKLPYDDNVALVRAATDVAQAHGAGVESELGRVSGEEDAAVAAERGALTDPEQAADFVARTGAACLAVSIGNIHGRYSRPPQLDWARLEAVRERVDVPLSLHGASGLVDEDLVRAVSMGIRKVNVNTELRDRWFEVLEVRGPELRGGSNVLALGEALIEAVREVVAAKLDQLWAR